MTDAGAFEGLATATLRYIEDDCRAVIHHGINALGKPIKSLVDAWCLVPESAPPRFVMLQHTTMAESSLNSKWLHIGNGDLYKTAEQAAKLRSGFPTARFRIFLTTNRVPSNELQTAVYRAAEKLGLEAVIVDQSRLADFLDSPEGQYLRRNFLGIEVDSLSEELLAELSSKSVDLHAQEFLTGVVVSRVEREIDRQLTVAVFDTSVSLHCLVADPGFGKSTTAQFILRQHIEGGGFGLWLAESTLEAASSLSDAITRTLCSLYPKLSPAAASNWAAVCGKRRLLVIIDDINRAANRIRLLQRLQGWTALVDTASSTQPRSQDRIVVICPVWTHVWEASRDPTKIQSWVRTISFGSLKPSEGADAVERVTASRGLILTRKEAEQCAANLNNDPYLIGIFGTLVNATTTRTELRQLTENVIRKYVDRMLREASSRSNDSFTATDLRETLRAIVTQMLLKKDLRPLWSKVRAWLNELPHPIPQGADFLRSDARICRLAEGDVLTFRHDRLMHFLAVECLPQLLKFESVITEVYFAEMIGQVLANTIVDETQLAKITATNPLALFQAIRVIGDPATDFQSRVAAATIAWARDCRTHTNTPEALQSSIGLALMETDSRVVPEIVRYLPPDYRVLAAEFRNGSASAGASFLAEMGRHTGFEPNIRNTWRDNVLFHAFRNHRERLVAELREILPRQDLTLDQACGAILLAGYLTAPELSQEVVRCVENSNGNWRLLPEAIWAIGRAGGESVYALLDRLFVFLRDVSNEEDEHGWSPRHAIARAFGDLSGTTFRPEIVNHIMRRADAEPPLQDVLFPLIHAMNLPDSLEHLARHKATRAKARGKTEVSRMDFWFSRWDPSNDMHFVPPSHACRDRLRSLWQSTTEDQVVRSAAFTIWSWTAETNDLLYLREISDASPQFSTALWKRAQLRDITCVPDLCERLRQDPWFAHVAHHVWCADLFVVVNEWLERFEKGDVEHPENTAYCFEHLLILIPTVDAEKLLSKNWVGLRQQRYFIQAALLISSTISISLADEAIRARTVSDPFEYLDMRMNDVRQMNPKWSVTQFLRQLEPYLDLLSEKELSSFPQYLKWAGEMMWCHRHILPRLPDNQRRAYIADESSIRSELEHVAQDEHGWRFPHFVFERLIERDAQPKKIIDTAASIFDLAPSIRRYSIMAEAVVQLGDRSDMPILNRPLQQDWKDAAELIRTNAEFRVRCRTLSGESTSAENGSTAVSRLSIA
jgi:hypothetical protein